MMMRHRPARHLPVFRLHLHIYHTGARAKAWCHLTHANAFLSEYIQLNVILRRGHHHQSIYSNPMTNPVKPPPDFCTIVKSAYLTVKRMMWMASAAGSFTSGKFLLIFLWDSSDRSSRESLILL